MSRGKLSLVASGSVDMTYTDEEDKGVGGRETAVASNKDAWGNLSSLSFVYLRALGISVRLPVRQNGVNHAVTFGFDSYPPLGLDRPRLVLVKVHL